LLISSTVRHAETLDVSSRERPWPSIVWAADQTSGSERSELWISSAAWINGLKSEASTVPRTIEHGASAAESTADLTRTTQARGFVQCLMVRKLCAATVNMLNPSANGGSQWRFRQGGSHCLPRASFGPQANHWSSRKKFAEFGDRPRLVTIGPVQIRDIALRLT
jgi:hypothetical protein